MTQASNFSRLRRSAASPVTETLSTPNLRKHSARVFLAGSFILTRATRAAAFLGLSVGMTAVPKALSIDRVFGPAKSILYCSIGNGKGEEGQFPGTKGPITWGGRRRPKVSCRNRH